MSGMWKRWLRRWRLVELRLLLLALVVSVTAVTAVGFFTSRVENAMQREAHQLLGGDLVLTSSRPLDKAYERQARELGLEAARTVTFPSVVSAGEKFQLSQVKAVSARYPLRGVLKTSASPEGAESVATSLPARGEIWAEARLFAELGVQPGATVQLGRSTLTLARVLTQEPDRGGNLFQLAPLVLINLDDLPATGLLTPLSRARFSLLFAGDASAVRRLQKQLEPQLKPVEQIRTLEDGLASVQQALQRSGRFLGLAALLSVVLAGAAVALTTASLMRRELSAVAILKAMGLSRRRVLLDQAQSLLLTALLATLLGVAAGFGLQFVLAEWLGSLIGKHLPEPGFMPIVTGLLTAVVLLLGFALPSLLALVNTAPIRILQGVAIRAEHSLGVLVLGVVAALFGLLWMQARDVRLAGMLLLGLLTGIAVFWLLAVLFLRLLRKLGGMLQAGWAKSLARSRRAALLVVVFATGLFALLLLTTVRTDLLDRWEATLPPDAPDHFLINIQPEETDALVKFLRERGVKAELYPMIRGRLLAINGQPVKVEDYDDSRARHLLEREFNLSSFAAFPSSNALVAGQWFDGKNGGFSIEKGIGETLHFGLGDRLTFDVAGQRFTDTVSSVREVRWDSMQPNFFVVAAPGSLDKLPSTFITSIYLGRHKNWVTALIHAFPSVTVIDVGAILQQVRSLIGQVSRAVEGIFIFTLVAGVIVLIAALQSQKAERRREIAILKSLGAGRVELRKRIWSEFLLLGGLAGLLAGLLAVTAGNLFAYFLFDLDMHFDPWPLLWGSLAGSLLVGAAGYWNLRGLLGVLPMSLLKG